MEKVAIFSTKLFGCTSRIVIFFEFGADLQKVSHPFAASVTLRICRVFDPSQISSLMHTASATDSSWFKICWPKLSRVKSPKLSLKYSILVSVNKNRFSLLSSTLVTSLSTVNFAVRLFSRCFKCTKFPLET